MKFKGGRLDIQRMVECPAEKGTLTPVQNCYQCPHVDAWYNDVIHCKYNL